MKKTLIIIVACISIFLVGCVNSDLTVDIGKDGKVNLSMKLLTNKQLLEKANIEDFKDIEKLKEEYQVDSVEKITENGQSGYLIKKKLGNIKDKIFDKKDSKGSEFVDIKEDKGFFFDTYDITINLKEAILGKMSSEEESMINLLGNSMKMDFHVISPYELLSSNASSTEKIKDGRTTYNWNYTLSDLGNMNIKFKVPNILNMVIVGCSLFSILAVIIVNIALKKKKHL